MGARLQAKKNIVTQNNPQTKKTKSFCRLFEWSTHPQQHTGAKIHGRKHTWRWRAWRRERAAEQRHRRLAEGQNHLKSAENQDVKKRLTYTRANRTLARVILGGGMVWFSSQVLASFFFNSKGRCASIEAIHERCQLFSAQQVHADLA